MLKSWSHSRLVEFEKCKFKVWLKNVQHIEEPERPLPPGKSEHANDRGSRVHDACEKFVNGTSDDLPPEADKHFGPQLHLLRVLHAEGKVSLEGEWGMAEDWTPTDWATAWLRLKLDAMVHLDKAHAIVIDYKTGKKWGNEIKHGEQLQLYMLTAFLRYPDLEEVHTELWYFDQNEVTHQTMTRTQALRFKSNFDRRGRAITTCVDFKPNPNRFSCKWCFYHCHEGGTGHCTVGVKT